MTTSAPESQPADAPLPDPRALRRLYFVRTVFSAVWVILVFVDASRSSPGASPLLVVLLVIYPLWDALATVLDLRADRTDRSHVPQFVNIGFDAAAAIGLGIGLTGSVSTAVGVFGAWAFVTGGVQLLLGLRRRKQGGQWAMIASGAISVVAGVSFVISAVSGMGAATSLAGYSLFGAVWFLVAVLFLTRAAARSTRLSANAGG